MDPSLKLLIHGFRLQIPGNFRVLMLQWKFVSTDMQNVWITGRQYGVEDRKYLLLLMIYLFPDI